MEDDRREDGERILENKSNKDNDIVIDENRGMGDNRRKDKGGDDNNKKGM